MKQDIDELGQHPDAAPNVLETIEVGSVPFAVSDLHNAVNWLLSLPFRDRPGVSVRLANSYCVALADSDMRYGRLLAGKGINFADGAPVAIVMRAMSRGRDDSLAKVGRVRGPSFFELALEWGCDKGVRHFFLGGTPETLQRLEKRVVARYPHVKIVGKFAPPFAPLSREFTRACAGAIAEASPDIVWVGIGTPKQDFLSADLADLTGMVCVGVGAAFDFSSGTVREAPRWIQNSGFEWLYRLALEPRRLWKRYLVGNVHFMALVIRRQLPAFLRAELFSKQKRS